jgi:ribosomal protein S18 acetylase RimI-like enzyme
MSFTTDKAYTIRSEASSLQLIVAPTSSTLRKQLPITLDETSWTQAFVAVKAGSPEGFIATQFQAWNRRLVVSHFYVNLPFRQQGIGRRLVDHALQQGKGTGALTAWIETSNLNYPAVEVYRSLGFTLCGFDATYYTGTPAEGEFALFLSRPLRDS